MFFVGVPTRYNLRRTTRKKSLLSLSPVSLSASIIYARKSMWTDHNIIFNLPWLIFASDIKIVEVSNRERLEGVKN